MWQARALYILARGVRVDTAVVLTRAAGHLEWARISAVQKSAIKPFRISIQSTMRKYKSRRISAMQHD